MDTVSHAATCVYVSVLVPVHGVALQTWHSETSSFKVIVRRRYSVLCGKSDDHAKLTSGLVIFPAYSKIAGNNNRQSLEHVGLMPTHEFIGSSQIGGGHLNIHSGQCGNGRQQLSTMYHLPDLHVGTGVYHVHFTCPISCTVQLKCMCGVAVDVSGSCSCSAGVHVLQLVCTEFKLFHVVQCKYASTHTHV